MQDLSLTDFPLKAYDKIRYGDTDRQGHVNNVTFATFFETGRVEILYGKENSLLVDGASFVLASIKIDYVKEIIWPGTVEIGTGIVKIGTSSINMIQHVFQEKRLVAKAETVSVQVQSQTGKSTPLSDAARQKLQKWMIGESLDQA